MTERLRIDRRALERGALQVAVALALGWVSWFAATRWWWPAAPAGAMESVAAAEPAPAPAFAAEGAGPPPSPLLPSGADVELLRARRLLVPVDGVEAARLVDDFSDPRSGGRRHAALDIAAPRDSPVRAVDDGTIAKLFTSEFGGLTVYQFDPTGRFCYYYAHLERYPRGIAEGSAVRRGDTVGYVGTSGNAPPDAPHLHFAIYRLGPDRKWWGGEPINPFLVFAPR
jgi:murein DD-endopeptidase MepM/ murein hydrolase activator NlpD